MGARVWRPARRAATPARASQSLARARSRSRRRRAASGRAPARTATRPRVPARVPTSRPRARRRASSRRPRRRRCVGSRAPRAARRSPRSAGDARVRLAEALAREDRQQRLVERAADAATARVFVHVDGDVRRPAVGGAFAVARGVGVAAHALRFAAHEPRVRLQRRGDAPAHLALAGRIDLEGDRRIAHDRVVDRRDAGGVLCARDADLGHASPSSGRAFRSGGQDAT